MIELTDAELDQVAGGQTLTGGGVATAFIAQGGVPGEEPVLSGFPGILNASEESGLNPPAHGTITAGVAQSG